MFVQRDSICLSVEMKQHSTGQELQVTQAKRLVLEVECLVEFIVVFVVEPRAGRLHERFTVDAVEE